MDLSRICIEPRLRSSWEAIDLGFMMARRWYRPLLLSWGIPCFAVALLAGLLLRDDPGVALVVVWWCKPLFDRLPLYFVSRALFSESVSTRQTLGQLPSLWWRGGMPWLTWRRFKFTRSFDQPVTVLEQLSGTQHNQRLQVLHRQNTGAAIWLTVVCALLEILVIVGVFALLRLLIPDQMEVRVSDLMSWSSPAGGWVYLVLGSVSMTLVAPFYVAAGFSLYISRRVELEAWDVEIRFRHLADTQLRKRSTIVSMIVVAGLSALLLGSPADCRASDISPEAPSEQVLNTPESAPAEPVNSGADARKLMKAVLAGKDFHVYKDVTRWRLKPIDTGDLSGNALPGWFVRLVELLENWLFSGEPVQPDKPADFSGLALGLEILLWCAAGLLIGTIIYVYRKEIKRFIDTFRDQRHKPEEKPQVLFGLDVSRDSLPDDIPTQVRQFCEQGDYRQGLSLLYRSTLSELMHQRNFTFYDSYTEGECVSVVRRTGDDTLSGFTEDVTAFWQRLAYGHQVPQRSAVEQLCLRWGELFDDEK